MVECGCTLVELRISSEPSRPYFANGLQSTTLMAPQQQFILSLFAYAAQRGVAFSQLEALTGVRIAALLAPDSRPLTTRQWDSLWLNAAQLTHDPLFGLHFGEAATPAALGVVSQLVQSSRTVGEALTHAAALLPALTNQLRLSLTRTAAGFSLQFRVVPAQTEATALASVADFFLAFVLHELDGLVLTRIRPRAVWFPPEASLRPDHCRVLRTETIALGAPGEYVLTFAGAYWDLPILTANYELQALLLRQTAALATPAAAGLLWKQVTSHLLANAYLGLPSLEALAANLCLSVRSLQRKLREEGTSYQQVADAVRKKLALHYLQAGAHPLQDVAHLLGYAEFSAFSRAFKRWTGRSPAHYQAEHSAEPTVTVVHQ